MNILETERLILSEQTEDDAAFIFTLLNSPGWLKYIGDRGVRNVDDARSYIINGAMKSYLANGFGLYLTKLKGTGTPVGICGLIKRPGLAHVDIGFAFLPEYEGKGYGYEAGSAVMNYAKNVLKIDIVVAITMKDNISSIKLLEKIGLNFKGMVTMPGDDEELMLFESRL
jgi:RimJ/RimL family protein N-acetyltransferase